jgi:hypothetical protein
VLGKQNARPCWRQEPGKRKTMMNTLIIDSSANCKAELAVLCGDLVGAEGVAHAAPERDRPLNLAQVVRDARMSVCVAYHGGGHDAALAALGAASIRLYRWVRNGSLRGDYAHNALWAVADNLTLTAHFGEETIFHAIDAGPSFYGESSAVDAPPASPEAAALYEAFNRKMAAGGKIDRLLRGGA